MPPVGFEPTVLAGERPQTHALDREATGIGVGSYSWIVKQLNTRVHSLKHPVLIILYYTLN